LRWRSNVGLPMSLAGVYSNSGGKDVWRLLDPRVKSSTSTSDNIYILLWRHRCQCHEPTVCFY
jgi:hypothetical protein